MNKLKQLFGKTILGSGLVLVSKASMAITITSANAAAAAGTKPDKFYEFYDFVNKAVGGGLGIGIALTSLLVGAGIGAAKSSAMPAIAGIVLASIIGFGPSIMGNLINSGALV